MVVMGNILEAVLVSNIDGFCVEIPGCTAVRPIVTPCNGGDKQALSINIRSGILGIKNGYHLTSRNNSAKDQAEIGAGYNDEYTFSYTKGNLWKFENGNVINRFGFCLERVKLKDKESSVLIQAKCEPTNSWQRFYLA